jgi:spermidine/putrescine transport system substrate-binding protein
MSSPSEFEIERALRAMQAAGVSRRTLLKRTGGGALSLGMIGFLAACGDDDGGGTGEARVIPKGEVSDRLTFANWPLYIDVDEDTEERPTLEKFERRYGTRVRYVEEINDNVEFFGKVRQQYEQGNSGGRDLHVVTDWLCNRMNRLGYVQKFDKEEMPNAVRNIEDAVASPDFDPNREISMPWQSGQVLIIYRRDMTGGEVRSINDLFDSRFRGKVTMLTEMRDTVGSVLLGEGIDPEDATKDQALAAIEKVERASRDGQIRRFTGNEYTRDIARGDTVALLGWSGDAVQLLADNRNIAYSQPEEGFMIFTDSMQIPVGAPNAFTAQKMIDFVYRPEIQAAITEYVNYVPPVKGAREILQDRNPEIAENELIFPDLSEAHNFKSFPDDEEQEIEAAFQRAIGA